VPTAWFFGPMVRDDVLGHGRPTRFNFIRAQSPPPGLNYDWWELLGGKCVCKVTASDAVLDQIAAIPGVDRLNKDLLDEPLADLPDAAKVRLRAFVEECGFTVQEINEHLPNPIGTYTLRQVLRFLQRRWRRWIWNGSDIVQEPIDRAPPRLIPELMP
jgi:hypothetical protein